MQFLRTRYEQSFDCQVGLEIYIKVCATRFGMVHVAIYQMVPCQVTRCIGYWTGIGNTMMIAVQESSLIKNRDCNSFTD